MKYYRTTLYNPGPPMDLNDTEIVYLSAKDPGDLLPVAMLAYSKPVKEYEEITEEVYNENIE